MIDRLIRDHDRFCSYHVSRTFEDVELFAPGRRLAEAVAANGGAFGARGLFSEFGQLLGFAAMAVRGRIATRNAQSCGRSIQRQSRPKKSSFTAYPSMMRAVDARGAAQLEMERGLERKPRERCARKSCARQILYGSQVETASSMSDHHDAGESVADNWTDGSRTLLARRCL